MRKSRIIEELESRHGRPLREIVIEAYNTTGSVRKAARSLDVPMPTFYGWLVGLSLSIRYAKSVETVPPE